MNHAVGQARGRYILWLRPGVEFIHEGTVGVLKASINDHFDADILYSHKLASHDPAKEPDMVLFQDWYARNDDLAYAMAGGLCIPTDMLLVRRNLYRLAGGYEILPPGRCQETFAARVAGLKRYNLKLIDEVLYRSPCDESYTSLDDASREDVRQVARVLYVNHNVYPIERSGTPLSTLHHALGVSRRGVETAVLIPAHELKGGFSREPRDGFTLYRVPALNRLEAYCAAPGQETTADYRKIIEDVVDDFCPQVVQVNDYVFMPAEVVEIFSRRGCIVLRNVCNCEELCHQDYPVLSSGLNGRLCPGPESPGTCTECLETLPDAALRNLAPQGLRHPLGKEIDGRFTYIRRLYRDAVDMVVFTSEPFRDYFTRFIPIPPERTRVIPRGFDFAFPRTTVRNSRPGGILRFAFVGNIMFSKGIDVALRAFEQVCGRGGLAFHVYGQIVNPEYQQWLDRLQSEQPEAFIYHGAFTDGDLPAIAAAIDVCIVPSYFDTYNRVLREFLYLGIPVIATDFFGAYIVQDGTNGFRVPVGDADALAGKMLDLINTPTLVDDLARGAMQTQIPGLDEEIDALLETYRDLYAHSSGTRKVRLARMLTTRGKRSPSVAGTTLGKAYVLQARSALTEGRLEDAIGLLDEALSQNPVDPQALHQLALLRHRQGDVRQAVELLEKAVALAPGDAELTNDLGTLCYLNGDHDRAVTL
ncbi:MAG TPA: glycosyltransferase, partial [Deltaproteobacteria bacterium]|nr:glycosyltransferase [Deltaproteobacteria bacterium]